MSNPKTADNYIGYRLYPKASVEAYTAVNSSGNGVNLIRIFDSGIYIGRIFSWIQHNGQLWWVIEDNPTAYKDIFVKHKEGIFSYKPPFSSSTPNSPLPEKSFSQAIIDKVSSIAKYSIVIYVGMKIVESVLVAEISKPTIPRKKLR